MIQFFDAVKADRTRSWLYAACSLSYLGAMVSSNSALQFVSYPTQVERGVRRGGRGETALMHSLALRSPLTRGAPRKRALC